MVKNQGHLEPQEALSFHTMCCTINIIYNFSTQRKFLVPDNPFGKDVKIEMILTSVKKGLYFLHTNSYIAFDLFFLLSFSDNVHFYVFWCLLARSKTQYQSFCDWVVWGQNRTKRCKSYFVFHIISKKSWNMTKLLFSGSQCITRKPQIHLVPRIGDLWSRKIWTPKSAQGNVRCKDSKKSNNTLWIGVSIFINKQLTM